MRILICLLAIALTVHADPLSVDKSPRMAEIETKYHMRMAGILRTPEKSDYWAFMITEPSCTFRTYPVVVPKDASDHDVDVAIIAASHCAVFYETNLKREPEPTPSPNDNSFTPPTHPPTHETHTNLSSGV